LNLWTVRYARKAPLSALQPLRQDFQSLYLQMKQERNRPFRKCNLVFAQRPRGMGQNTWRGPGTGASIEDWFERPLKKGKEEV